jgi:hypothetical protein
VAAGTSVEAGTSVAAAGPQAAKSMAVMISKAKVRQIVFFILLSLEILN